MYKKIYKKGVRKRNQRFRRTHVKTVSQYFTNIRNLTLLYTEKSTLDQDKIRFFLYNKKARYCLTLKRGEMKNDIG